MRTVLRKIGNSAGTIIPAPILRKLNLKEGDGIDIDDVEGRIVIKPAQYKPRYSLSDLLAQCDESAPMPQELTDWENVPEVGNEGW